MSANEVLNKSFRKIIFLEMVQTKIVYELCVLERGNNS